MIIAVDPGKNTGIAVFGGVCPPERKRLDCAMLVEGTTRRILDALGGKGAGFMPGDTLVVEFPKVYAGGKAKGDPADLLELAALVGALEERGRLRDVGVKRYLPHEWKRQLDKATTKARVIERLTPEERQKIPDLPKSKEHNVYDAIGIGLFHIGRFHPKRIIAR